MGAQDRVSFVPPPQPPAAKAAANPFATAYAPVTPGNPFEVYDDGLDDDGADAGRWEVEALGTRSEARFWQPRFYSAYFDINVADFAARLTRAVLPFKPLLGWAVQEEESQGGTSVPDLYGPVWVTTTLVLALSMGSKIAHFAANVFRKEETGDVASAISSVEFTRLWKAASLLYGYVFIFPVILTIFQCLFVRRSLRESSVSAHPVLGTVMVYGYSMTPVVLAALVATVPIELVQLIAMAVAFFIGAFVVMLNLWRDVSIEHRSLTYFVRLLAVLAHAGVGAAITLLFYWPR